MAPCGAPRPRDGARALVCTTRCPQVGTATGLIGDPSGKSEDRVLLGPEAVASNAAGVRSCVEGVLAGLERRGLELAADSSQPWSAEEDGPALPEDLAPGGAGAASSAPAVVENGSWYEGLSALALLRDVGRHFRVGQMLARDSVRSRMESQAGMSFTEFSYQLLQAWDFRELSRSHGCVLQLGGSDQWGNITAGVDLVRRVDGVEVFGVTSPLVTTAAGAKIGKSEGNAVWLTEEHTSHFSLYQYCMGMADEDAVSLLRRLTLLPGAACDAVAAEHAAAPHERGAQRTLAREVLAVCRGPGAVEAAEAATSALFGGGGVSAEAAAELVSAGRSGGVPCAVLPRVVGASVLDLAVAAGVATTKAQVRRLIKSGGVRSGGRVVTADRTDVEEGDLAPGGMAVLRLGKKNPFVAVPSE